MKNLNTSLLILFFIYICNHFIDIHANKESNVYIAYLGDKPHDDHQRIVESHHDLLASVVGGKEHTSKLMVHNYKYGFSGFSAILTESQAKELAASPNVIHLIPDHGFHLQGTKFHDYLGLSAQIPNGISQKTNQGDGIIIGIIDSGIWANGTKAFSDEGYGPIPSRWKGKCVSSGQFIASQQCNKKVIGAMWHRKGATAKGFAPNDDVINEDTSPLDMHGHGTHCASIAAGSAVSGITYSGHQMGTFRGAAPRARLSIYKPCFKIRGDSNENDMCFVSDIIEAFDQALHDGVDVISISLGPGSDEGDIHGFLNFASYHAVMNGISVVAAAGNSGPGYQTLSNTSPWQIIVAAASIDEGVMVPITLGNNNTFLGEPVSRMEEGALGLKKLVTFDNSILHILKDIDEGRMPSNNTLAQMIKGNVAFFPDFSKITSDINAAGTVYNSIKSLGGVSLIVDKHESHKISYSFHVDSQVIVVDKEVARQIYAYTRLNVDSMATFGKPKLVQSKSIRSTVDNYSSRGPSKHTPMILKPDIAAPGTDILAAVSVHSNGNPVENGWQVMSGTSMATPMVAGVVALLKAAHPNWSPAAIKSALVTTGSNIDPHGAQILSLFSPSGIAGPLDFGGGIANPNGATDPGLIYDMQSFDYLNYLCGVGYPITDIKNITRDQNAVCPNQKQSLMDVNLPSIGISGLQKSMTIKRTVTNVGPENSSYIAQINAPNGTKIIVSPNVLKFDANCKQITFEMTIEKIQNVDKYAGGSLTWIDNGNHHVRSPIVVLS